MDINGIWSKFVMFSLGVSFSLVFRSAFYNNKYLVTHEYNRVGIRSLAFIPRTLLIVLSAIGYFIWSAIFVNVFSTSLDSVSSVIVVFKVGYAIVAPICFFIINNIIVIDLIEKISGLNKTLSRSCYKRRKGVVCVCVVLLVIVYAGTLINLK